MTPKKLATCIELYSSLITDALVASAVIEFAQVIKPLKIPKGSSVASLLSEKLESRSESIPSAVSLKELTNALRPLLQILAAASAPSTSKQINALLSLLIDNSSMSFASFLTRIGASSSETSERASRYLAELNATIADETAFSEVLTAIRSDRQLQPEDLSGLASAFTGLTKKWARKTALEAIASKHKAYLRALSAVANANGKSAA